MPQDPVDVFGVFSPTPAPAPSAAPAPQPAAQPAAQPAPANPTDRASYESWESGRIQANNVLAGWQQLPKHITPAQRTSRFSQPFVSAIDPSRKSIREKSLAMRDPVSAVHHREYTRQARMLLNDRATRMEPKETLPAFVGGWQDGLLSEMATKHNTEDRHMADLRAGCVQRTQRERDLSFEHHRQKLQKEHELVRPCTQPNVALRDLTYYQRSGMQADNPHMHVADSAIAWKQSVASRDAELKAASQFHSSLVERQKYLDAGLYGMTSELK